MPNLDKNDSESFARHLNPLQGALEAYCRRCLRGHDVEDALQNAVMKAFRDFSHYAEGTNFRAWIFKYLHLEILVSNRQRLRDQAELLSFEPIETTSAPNMLEDVPLEMLPEVSEIILDQCTDELAAAIRTLGATERSVLLLRAIADLKYGEIAEVLNLPIGTVMSHLSRSRIRLRLHLKRSTTALGSDHQRDCGSA